MPKISIIVPVFNTELYLRQCLDSLTEQTLEDIEIICINDGSTDNSLKILKEYAQKDDRIVILDKENEGPGIARNAALDIANGEYIMFTDSDDWLTDEACEKAYNQISKNSDDMVFFGHFFFIDDTQKLKKYNRNIKPFSQFYNGESFHLYDMKELFINSAEIWNRIYKKTFIDKYNIRLGTEKVGEDLQFFFSCIANAKSVSVLNDYIYIYRKSSSSITTTGAIDYWKELLNSRFASYDILCNSEYSNVFLKTCISYFINSLMYWYTRWSKIKGFPKKEYYKDMHNFFHILYTKYRQQAEESKYYINDYREFKRVSNENWEMYNFNNFIKRVFSVVNKDKHKIINILGFKIKLKYNRLNKKYLQSVKYYKSNIKRIKNKVKNNQKIKTAFYVNDTKFKCLNLYNTMLKSKYYEPFIIVGKNSCDVEHREYQSEEEIKRIYENYKNEGFAVFYGYDFDKKQHIPLDNFNPDIVFYSRQFNLDKIYSPDKIAKKVLSCYVPYFISNSNISLDCGYDFHNLLWKYYVLNDDLIHEYTEIMANKGKNLKAAGYPFLDDYLNKEKNGREFVIYAPHWSIGETILKFSTFDWNGQYILDFAKMNPQIKWVFKPHPILKNQLVESGFMSREEVEEYYNEWAKIGVVYEGNDYLKLFKNSKAMITDCGSFLAEYMPSENPVILLRSKNAAAYNFLAKKVTRYYYQVWNIKELETMLQKILIQNKDYYLERRLDMLNKLHLVTNASQNIIDDLNKEFGIINNG